jgi:ferric-dicitrate binding protein FerR (iron transport regulator)
MKESLANQSFNQKISQSVHHFSVPSEVSKEAALESLLAKTGTTFKYTQVNQVKQYRSRRLFIITSVAASLIISLVTWAILDNTMVRNDTLQALSFRLPDQSRIVLASGSTVQYRKFPWNRKIRLEGNGYFEVVKGGNFRVMTTRGKVEVLGTRFLTGEADGNMQVICYEGKVRAVFGEQSETLTSGSGIRFTDKGDRIMTTPEESFPSIAVFKGEYQNVNAETIVRELESFFGIRISYETDRPRFFSGSIRTGDPNLALSILTTSLNLNCEHDKNNKIRIFKPAMH